MTRQWRLIKEGYMESCLAIREAAGILRLLVLAVRRYVMKGEIPHHKICRAAKGLIFHEIYQKILKFAQKYHILFIRGSGYLVCGTAGKGFPGRGSGCPSGSPAAVLMRFGINLCRSPIYFGEAVGEN
jgi:hypothetical protein